MRLHRHYIAMSLDSSLAMFNIIRQQYAGFCLRLFFLAAVGINQALADSLPAAKITERDGGQRVNVLQGKRLFFDSVERTSVQSESSAGQAAESIRQELASPGSALDERARNVKSDARVGSTRPSRNLSYEAHIESSRAVRLIVNGLPCERLSRSNQSPSDAMQRVVDCPDMSLKDLTLILLEDGKSLKIIDGEQTLGVLGPGQSL